MIKRILSLVALVMVLSSCAAKNYGAVDLSKLRDKNEKYGIVVFRSMFFKYEKDAKVFSQNDNKINLDSSNEAYVFAKDSGSKQKYDYSWNGYQIGGAWSYKSDWEEKRKKFIMQKGKMGWTQAGAVPEILMPEYFYTIKMMPEGRYYFSRTIFDFDYRRYLEQEFGLNDSPFAFTVRSGHINYLGDLYFLSPEKQGFWGSKYSAGVVRLNKSHQAEEFMRKYHPEINLPFMTNLIISNNN